MAPTEFRAEFEVARSPDEAWQMLVEHQPERGDQRSQWWLPGFDGTGDALKVEPGTRLRVRKNTMPCEGTIIDLALEATDHGTRVTAVQSGFDESFVATAGPAFWITAEQIEADLQLFFRRGVHGERHSRPWAFAGFATEQSPMGLVITDVYSETFAERARLEPGDLLLTLAGAPIVNPGDLATVLRVVSQGSEVEVTWARDHEHIRARARL